MNTYEKYWFVKLFNILLLLVAAGKGTGLFHWVRGPSPGSEHDITMLRCYGLEYRLHLADGELVLADKGYQGHKACVVPYRGHGYGNYHQNCNQCEYNFKLSSTRIIIERAFSRVKNFRCLSTRWRHDLRLHPVAFCFVAALCNIINKFHPLLKSYLSVVSSLLCLIFDLWK